MISHVYSECRRVASEILFERRYGVSTMGVVGREELGFCVSDQMHYSPSSWRTLSRVLRPREISNRDVFIDFGSGKGRAVLQAANYPFGQVIGIELSKYLNDIAIENLKRRGRRMRCKNVTLVCADVLEYEIPDSVTVAFFFNPFTGEIFSNVVQRLIASFDKHPRRLRIIYENPVEEAMLLDTGRVRQVWPTWKRLVSRRISCSLRMYEVCASADTINRNY